MKARQSKLDAHAEQLRAWEAQGMTLAEMAVQLQALGCSASLGRLSCFLAAQRESALRDRLLTQITSGSRACKEVEKQFAKDAPPALESLIKLHRVLIMQLATQASADPALVELVTGSMKPLLKFAELQLKEKTTAQAEAQFRETLDRKDRELHQAERKLVILEKKAAAFDQLKAAANSGGITPETLHKIESELKLL